MTAAHNLLLPFKRTRRIGGLLSFALVVAAGGLVYWLLQFDLLKLAILPAGGALLLALLALEAVPLLKPRINAGDGLTVDTEGLAFTRNGRVVRWRWKEITDVRLRRPFHPAGLLLGTFVTFRVPADERRAGFGFLSDRLVRWGSVMVVGNDYAGWPHDIFVQIKGFQDAAAGVESPLGGPMRIGEAVAPEPDWSFRKDRKQFKLWHAAWFALIPAVGAAMMTLSVSDLPGSISEMFPIESISTALYGALVGAPLLIVVLLKRDAAQDNMLTLSAGGIGTRHNMDRRHWFWWEISDIQVTQSTSRGKDGAAARTVSFRAMQDGALPGRVLIEGKPATPVSCTIEDVYEMPVDDIARQVKAWWEWSNKAYGHPDDPEMAKLIEDQIGERVQGVSFIRHQGQPQQGSVLEALYTGISYVPMVAAIGVMIWILRAEAYMSIPLWGIIAGLIVFVAAPLIGAQLFIKPETSRLEIDDAGLRFTRMGRTGRWCWQDVGAAELRRVRSKWSAAQRTVLGFSAPYDGLGSRILRWALNMDGSQPQIVLEDIYDTSLEEIAEVFNEHRKGSGRQPRG